MKTIKKLICIFLLLVIGVFLYSFNLGKNLPIIKEANLKDVKNIEMNINDAAFEGNDEGTVTVNKVYDSSLDTYEKLYHKSNLIAYITLQDRVQEKNTICSKVKVTKIIKGDKELLDHDIYIYEPFGYKNKETVNLYGVYLPIRKDQVYMVFLKEEKNQKYNFVSSLYGKYNLEEDDYFTLNGNQITTENMISNDMIDFKINEIEKNSILENLKSSDYDELQINNISKGLDRLIELKDKREEIRKSISK